MGGNRPWPPFGSIAAKATVFSLVLSFISFFNGGVLYSTDETFFPPVWMQLARNFLIYFACFFITQLIYEWLISRRRKDNPPSDDKTKS